MSGMLEKNIVGLSSGQTNGPSPEEIAQAINLTRELLALAAKILPRDKGQKSGPNGHNRILAWVELVAGDLTIIKNGLVTSGKRLETFISRIMRLFPTIPTEGDVTHETLYQLKKEMAAHDFSRMAPTSNLVFVHRYFIYLALSNLDRKSELIFVLGVFHQLSLAKTVTDGNLYNVVLDPVTQLYVDGRGIFQSLLLQSWRFGMLLTLAVAIVLSIIFLLFGQRNNQSTASVLISPPSTSDSIITKAEAAQRLDVLWSNGKGFAAKGDDAMYFTSMKSAYDLANEVFGPESLEFARASNHMVGAYETTGHRDEAITVSRNSWKLFRRILGDKSLDALIEQVNLGARLSRKSSVSDKSEARGLLSDAIAKYDEAGDRPDMRLGHAHALEAYSIYFEENGDLPEAVTQSEKAVIMVETANVRDRINRAWIIANHAEMLHRDGQCAAAVAMYQRAIEAYKEAKIPITQRDYAVSLSEVARGC